MSKNILNRISNVNSEESYVYTYSQYPETAFSSQRLSSIRTSTSLNIITSPFGKKTGQWRALNLKVDPAQGYGSEEKGAILSFGFSKQSGNSPVSIACGFTLGVPPLHARHVNTVTRSICYGFILNPFPVSPGVDELYIVHENILSKLESGTNYSSLKIEIKGNLVTYSSSGQELVKLTMSDISMVLHVVGCLGFNGNEITNVSLAGGGSISFTPPDYQKEIYIPCLGLTQFDQNTVSLQNPIGSQKTIQDSDTPSTSFGIFTNIQIKGTSGQRFTVHYPNGNTKEFTPISTEPFISIVEENVNSFSPFTIKISFPGSLSTLKGLKVANPLISTELSLDQSLHYLTNLEQIEVRSSFSSSFNHFYPTIGENIPLPKVANSKLKLANIEGSYEIKEHDLSFQQQLTNLFIATHFTSNTFPKLASARNLTYCEVESTLDNWFLSNFRNIFSGVRNRNSHGLIRNSGGNSVTLSSTNTEGLAIAQQSYFLMYGLSTVSTENTSYFTPTTGSGFSITSQWTRRSITVNGVTFLIRDFIFDGITVDGNNLQKIVFYVYSSVTPPAPGQLFCIRTSQGVNNQDTLSQQLRMIASVETETESKEIVVNGVGIPVPYTKYTITPKKTKEHIDVNGVSIVSNSQNQLNTLAITGVNTVIFNEIEIGDTVWDRTSPSNFVTQEIEYKPAIVIRKEDDGRIIVLQGSGGTPGTSIQTGSNRNIRFGWEWSLLQDNISNPNDYPIDRKATDTLTFTTATTARTTDIFTSTRAAREYLV